MEMLDYRVFIFTTVVIYLFPSWLLILLMTFLCSNHPQFMFMFNFAYKNIYENVSAKINQLKNQSTTTQQQPLQNDGKFNCIAICKNKKQCTFKVAIENSYCARHSKQSW